MLVACEKLFQVSKKESECYTGKLYWHFLFILIWIGTDGKDFGRACQVYSSPKEEEEGRKEEESG